MVTYLLGAGFSKAFHSPMPLMRELGERVLDQLGLGAEVLGPFGGDLEAWLSYLANRQPWDDVPTSLDNEATFTRASEAIAVCIALASEQADARGNEVQQQLDRLVLEWRIHRSPVLTFNYDLLVEKAVHARDPMVTGWDLYPAPLVLREVQEGIRYGAGPLRQPCFELHKLHGSINWFHSTSNSTGPITMATADPGLITHEEGRQRYLFSDLGPLIVPPTSTKSGFYAGDAIRALWRTASNRLAATEKLIVIGYSFPPSDLQVLTMLRQTLQPEAHILVVTQDEKVAGRVQGAFSDRHVEALVDDDAANLFVNQSCGPIIEWEYRSQPTGEQQWLTVLGNTQTRFVPGETDCPPDTRALNQLATSWPSIHRTWQEGPAPRSGYRRFTAYVDRLEWDGCRDPWHPSRQPPTGRATEPSPTSGPLVDESNSALEG